MTTRTRMPTAAVGSAIEMDTTEVRTGIAAAIYFVLSIVYFFPAFLPGRHLFGTDYLAGGYYFYEFVSERLAAGEMPGWVPYIYGGLPLAANPGSTFYPVRLVADFLFPVTWILPFIFVVQLGMAGLGMCLLARELGCRSWIAFIAGLAFQFTGIIVSSVYAGHDGRVIVATFAPLVFFFLHRGIRTGRVGPFVGASATIGFSLLSFQIQSNYYLLLAGAIWAVFALVHLGMTRDPRRLAARVALGVAAVALGFTIAAVNFLPFLDYIPQSPRGAEGGRGFDWSVNWSMPPGELLGVAVPEKAGILDHYRGQNPFKLHTEYIGSLVLILTLLGFRFSRSNRHWWFFFGLAMFALTVAIGGHTPLYRLYYAVLPGTSLFRAPSIAFFIVSFSLVAMAAITLERFAAWREGKSADTSSLTPWLAGMVGVAVVAAAFAARSAGGEIRDVAMVAGFGRFALFTALTCGAIWLWSTLRLRSLGAVIVLAVLTVSDLWIVDRNFFETVPPPDVTFARDDVVNFLATQPQPVRVWVLPFPAGAVYQGGGNYLMHFNIDQAGGEHGNQLQRFNEFAGAGEEVYVDWSNFTESPNFLHAASVGFIISMAELEIPFLREVHRGSALIYENIAALPRAYLVGDVVATTDSTAALTSLASPSFDPARGAVIYGAAPAVSTSDFVSGAAEIIEHTPDRVVVRATSNGDALLVLTDNFYDGWRATVNGEDAEIVRTNHTFRGVFVRSGTNEVVFEYHSADLFTGFYIYLLALALLAGYGAWLSFAWLRRREDPV